MRRACYPCPSNAKRDWAEVPDQDLGLRREIAFALLEEIVVSGLHVVHRSDNHDLAFVDSLANRFWISSMVRMTLRFATSSIRISG